MLICGHAIGAGGLKDVAKILWLCVCVQVLGWRYIWWTWLRRLFHLRSHCVCICSRPLQRWKIRLRPICLVMWSMFAVFSTYTQISDCSPNQNARWSWLALARTTKWVNPAVLINCFAARLGELYSVVYLWCKRLLLCHFKVFWNILITLSGIFVLVAFIGKHNVTVWRSHVCPSLCLSRRHTHRDSPGAACDAASICFSLTIRRTDILVFADMLLLFLIYSWFLLIGLEFWSCSCLSPKSELWNLWKSFYIPQTLPVIQPTVPKHYYAVKKLII